MNTNPRHLIVRRAPSTNPAKGILQFGSTTWPCILGKNGITCRKTEGDMATPSGCFKLLFGYYRKDRLGMVVGKLPLTNITETMGWCDDPLDPRYNRPVILPFKPSCEHMYRQDCLYDLVIVMDHNYSRRIRNRGSAVFFHLTDQKPYTAGCVAIAPHIMKLIIPHLTKRTKMIIKP